MLEENVHPLNTKTWSLALSERSLTWIYAAWLPCSDSDSTVPHFIALISSKPNFFVSPKIKLISEVFAVILSKATILTFVTWLSGSVIIFSFKIILSLFKIILSSASSFSKLGSKLLRFTNGIVVIFSSVFSSVKKLTVTKKKKN